MEKTGGFVGRDDLTLYKVAERAPIRGHYRGWEILGPPPPAASGVHIAQMLNILEGYDVAKLGFGTVDTLNGTLEVFAGMVQTLKVKAGKAGEAVDRGYILATDLADYLVDRGEAFRTAHEIVGKLVSYAAGKNKTFQELTLKEYQKFSPRFGEDVRKITVKTSLADRDVTGGTAPRRVKQALAKARRLVVRE